MSVNKKKRNREVIISYIEKTFNEDIKNIYENFVSEEHVSLLVTFEEILHKKLELYLQISESIADKLNNDEEYKQDVEEVMDIEVSVRNRLHILRKFITEKQQITYTTTSSETSTKSSKHDNFLKLPKFEIKKFSGDATAWQTFIETFNASIDQNSSLSDIQKMSYLLSFLEGEAAATIKGLPLSNDNYKNAIKLLTERFGDPQVLISAHMTKLLSMGCVVDVSDIKGLRCVYDEVEGQVRSLRCLGLDPQNYGSMYVPILFEKLPDELKLIISRNQSGRQIWDINLILQSFKSELEAREKISSNSSSYLQEQPYSGSALFASAKNSSSNHTQNNRNRNNNRNESSRSKNFSCIFCGRDNHLSKNCSIVSKPEARKEILFKERRCFICMKRGHVSAKCQNKLKCYKCEGRHHVAVCTFKPSKEPTDNSCKNPPPEEIESKEDTPELSHQGVVSNTIYGNSLINVNKNNCILLQTARARISSVDEKKCENLRILFDSGSQLSYISPQARKRLNLDVISQKPVSIKTFGNMQKQKVLDQVKFAVKSRDGNFNIYVEAFVSDICYPLEQQVINLAQEKYKHLQNLVLADSNPENLAMNVDVLIGAQDYWNFIEHKTVRGQNGPVAVASKLGFILSGPVENIDAKVYSSNNVVSTHFMKVEAEILEAKHVTSSEVKSFFSPPVVDAKNLANENRDDVIIKQFKQNIKFENNRYEVKLPFKEVADQLGDNYLNAKNRLKTLTQKFKNNNELLIEYDKIINEQRNCEIIEHAPDYKVNETHYLPHRPVIRDSKASTKIRIVFDASCKSSKQGPSLNDVLEAGPSLTPLLQDVLLRFRGFNYAIIADIEKAFLQIHLAPEHRDYVRFLWFKDFNNIDFDNFENNELVEYRLCRVLFGVTSSPFLLSATIIHHSEIYLEADPDFVDKLLSSLHVDDLTSGENDIPKAFTFYKSCKETLQEGGFNLRKFKSNSVELENMVYSIYPEDKQFSEDEKVLGLLWDKNIDSINFDFNEIQSKFTENPTKRSLSHSIASIYDPLGLITPVVVKMKILFQDVCIEKFDWDDLLSPELKHRWYQIISELNQVDMIRISRKYCFNDVNDPIIDVQTHVFSDASKRTYAFALYLRFKMKSGNVKTTLVTSKSKLLSINAKDFKTVVIKGKITIPRAELNGVLLMTQVTPHVIESLKSVYEFSSNYFWTDSSIVFAWIRNFNKKYKRYVQKRLEKIRKTIVNFGELKLVPSKWNPADIGTRGLTPQKLCESDLWFYGPSFLAADESAWPNLQIGDNFKDYEYEEEIISNKVEIKLVDKVGTCLLSVNGDDARLSRVINISKFNSLTKLVRVTSWVIKFVIKLKKKIAKKEEEDTIDNINNKKESVTEENITAEEFINAKMLWVKEVQRDLLLHKNFQNLKLQLDLFCDEHGFWRCGGRLKNAPLAYEVKYPLILLKEHSFSSLVILNSHIQVKHNGPRETINHLRTEFWIPACRNLVRKIIHECTLCRIFEGKAYDYPKVAPLPEARVTQNHAFTNVGIDYAGPVYVKNVYIIDNDITMHKAWICLITCASSRCIYLDLVPDCTGQACVNVLTRFINSRGAPKLTISDNGSAFISNEVQSFASVRGMRWKFNIPKAPWMGGFFERLIKSVKRCLKKLLLNARVNYDEMLTVLREIENILNNRPLTFLYSDDLSEPLTPNKLLYGRNLETVVTDHQCNEVKDDDVTKRVVYIRNLIDKFWLKWKAEYLLELREYHRGNSINANLTPKVNDVVLIYEDKVKRSQWRMGKIHELIKSKDGKVRACVVDVISNGVKSQLTRPVNKLYPVEFSKNDEKDKVKITFVDETKVPAVFKNDEKDKIKITFVDETKVPAVFGKMACSAK